VLIRRYSTLSDNGQPLSFGAASPAPTSNEHSRENTLLNGVVLTRAY